MTEAPLQEAVVFAREQSVFGAFDAETSELVCVVEAESEIQGLFNVDAVAPLVGYNGVWQLVVVELDELPSGVPSFLKAYFESGKADHTVAQIAPGTDAFQ